jgi:hypothetical protein
MTRAQAEQLYATAVGLVAIPIVLVEKRDLTAVDEMLEAWGVPDAVRAAVLEPITLHVTPAAAQDLLAFLKAQVWDAVAAEHE